MTSEFKNETAGETMRRINRVWLSGQVEDLIPMVHPEIVMTFPGFAGRVEGRNEFLAGFRDFCQSAAIQEFRDFDYQTDVVGNTCITSFEYDMLYDRAGERYRAIGRDLWVFQNQDGAWIAVWRTMLDMKEQAA